MENIVINSRVKMKRSSQGPYYVVIQEVGTGRKKRVFQDCEHFPKRSEAQAKIPEMDADLKDALEKGLF